MKFIKKPNQRGMGLLELLLLLIILILLSLIGWYVLTKDDDAKNKSTETAQTDSQSDKAEKKPEVKYFEFKEFGVKVEQNDALKNMSYTATKDVVEGITYTYLFLNDSEVGKLIAKCNNESSNSGNFAALTKGEGQFPAEPEPGVGLLKQFDSFYIAASYPNGTACPDDADNQPVYDLWTSLQKALQEAFKKAEKI